MAQDTRFTFFDYADLDSRTCQQLQSILSATSKPNVELPWLDTTTISNVAENLNDTLRDEGSQIVAEQAPAQPPVEQHQVPAEPLQVHVSSGYSMANPAVVCIPAQYFPPPPMPHMAMLPGGMLTSHGAVYHRFAAPPPHPVMFSPTHGMYYSVVPAQPHQLPSHLAAPMGAAPMGATMPPHVQHMSPSHVQHMSPPHAQHMSPSHVQHMSPPQHGLESMPLSMVPPPGSNTMVITQLPVPSGQGSMAQCMPINNSHQYVLNDSMVYEGNNNPTGFYVKDGGDINNQGNNNPGFYVKDNIDNQICNSVEAANGSSQLQQVNYIATESNEKNHSATVPVAYSSHYEINETNNNGKGSVSGDDKLEPAINATSIEFEKMMIIREDMKRCDNAGDVSINSATLDSPVSVVAEVSVTDSTAIVSSAAATALKSTTEMDIPAMVNGATEVPPTSNIDADTSNKHSPREVLVNGNDCVADNVVPVFSPHASSTVVDHEVSPPQVVRQGSDVDVAKSIPKAKVTSWASLLQNTQTAHNAIVIQMVDGLGSPAASERSARSDAKSASSGNIAKENSAASTEPCMDSTTEQKARKELSELVRNYKLCHKSVALQPRGLTNRTNWCYVNSTLQALLACPPFYHLMKQLSASSQQPFPAGFWEANKMPVIKSMVDFVSEFSSVHVRSVERQSALNSKGTVKQDIKCGTPFEPVDVYKMLQAIDYEAFKQGQQEDAEEFLSCILNRLHDEMVAANKWQDVDSAADHSDAKGKSGANLSNGNHGNGVTGDVVVGDINSTDLNDDARWEQVKSKNRTVFNSSANDELSPISAIFKGQLCCLLHQLGQKESATLEPFFTLQLDIQNESVTSVHDALEQLVSKESLQGYTCTKSKIEVDATRRVLIEELPPVLVLHLKWFTYNKSGGLQKCMKQVDFDIDLELSKDLLTGSAKLKSQANHRKYKLFAAVSHIGARAVGGHYTADVFHPGYQCWLRCDDNNIVSVPASSVTKFSAPRVPYLIFYRRLDLS